MQQKNIAIIGAGFSGLVLAHQLTTNYSVQLFEKSRGLGGRLATRYAEPYQFDHGAQSFSAQSATFQDFLTPLQKAGVIAPWETQTVHIQNDGTIITEKKPAKHYVGVPKMNQVGKYLAEGLQIQRQTRITQIQGIPHAWTLQDETGTTHGPYHWVVSSAPPAQTTALLPPGYLPQAHTTQMTGCYALMLGFAEPLPIEWQAANVQHPDIQAISLNHTKPGRPAGYSMVILSTDTWAETHAEAEKEWVQKQLIQTTSNLIQQDLIQATHHAVHHWRYARCLTQPTPLQCIDRQAGLAACGDWCQQNSVEAAYQTALRTAKEITHAR
jgi:predicted NAD/FAD-dependent oxidoreductase